MLEIVVIFLLARHLANLAERKGHRRLWSGLVPVLWVGSEFAGAFAAALLGIGGLPLYGFALVAALAGGALSYLIVTALPDRTGALAMAQATGRTADEIKHNPFA